MTHMGRFPLFSWCLVHRSGSVRGQGRIILQLLIARHYLRGWLLLKAVQPVKEINQHLQRVLLAGLHHFAKIWPLNPRIWFTLELEALPLGRNGVVEEKLRRVLESLWENIFGEVKKD